MQARLKRVRQQQLSSLVFVKPTTGCHDDLFQRIAAQEEAACKRKGVAWKGWTAHRLIDHRETQQCWRGDLPIKDTSRGYKKMSSYSRSGAIGHGCDKHGNRLGESTGTFYGFRPFEVQQGPTREEPLRLERRSTYLI